MEFAKTKNILHVMKLRGYKRIENTVIYAHLINFESEEWNVAHAKTLAEEDELIKTGFDFARFYDVEKVAIYRKRK
jgi:hypothetical protein